MTTSSPKVQALSPDLNGIRFLNPESQSPYKFILLHGYGANCMDLFPLAPFLKNKSIGEWIFIDGVMAAPGVPGGRAWFPLDIEALEKAIESGSYRDFSGPLPEEMTAAREKIETFIDTENLDREKTVIGGFSQGSMLATDLYLRSPVEFAGLAILSGTWLGENEWRDLAKKRAGHFFQSHGKSDELLPYDRAEKLAEMLKESKWQGELVSFDGGHEIPIEVLKELDRFLTGRCPYQSETDSKD